MASNWKRSLVNGAVALGVLGGIFLASPATNALASETHLKSDLDRHSDISSKLQVEMNTKSSILRSSTPHCWWRC